MRLHRLSMTAIGPFAEPARIDLARFGDSGLFLLEGPTGSGKSTVLDSISFALYGKLAQSSAVVERLKSHHAPAGTEPVVELVFETQSGLYRVRRTPSYERPKKRASGTTTVHMSVKLWRLSSADDLDGGELLSHNIGDVEDEITRAVGLSHAQFVQTVLLPQGEFANFLRADTSTKRVLLQRLFGTELLARTQQELIDGRRAAEQSRAAALDSVRHACHAFAGAAGLAEDRVAELIELAELADRTGLAQLLAGVQGGLQATELRAAADREAAAAGRLDAEAALRRSQDLLRRREIRDRLRDEQRQLAEASEQVEQARAELAAGRRAQSVVPAADALTAALGRSDSAQDAQARARDAIPEQLYGATESRLREVTAQHRTTVGELAGELRRERELTRLRDEHEQLVGERAELGELLSAAGAELAALPARTAELLAAREQAAVAAGRLESLAAERDRATGRLVAARQAVAAAREAASNQQLAQEVFEAADRQRGRLESLRLSWRANIASELGLALQSGDPCAVCGSLEHPRPARPTVDHVSRDEVSAAESELHTLETSLQQHRQQLAEQQAELADLRARADQLSPELAEVTLARASQAWAEAEASADRLPSIEAGLAEQERQLAQLRDQVQAAALAETRLAERVSAVLAAIERDELAVHQARFGYRTVAERVAQLNHDIETIELAAAASAAADAALAAALQAGQTFHSALDAAGFADQAAWQRALRNPAELTELAGRLGDYDEQVAAVEARLNTAELIDSELDTEVPALAGLVAACELAQAAEDEAARAHGAAAHQLAAAASQAEQLERAVRRGTRLLAETAPAIRIGNLVAGLGENQLKMELTTYVLARRFAEIVSAANAQLRQISGGRYQLEHTDARSGNARSGLGLRVLDLGTGRPRDPGTLSGGETFYVSLSLALGLADIVRAESGGIDLGTLFIDEGFGTLDPDVLDQVIAVLDGLRAGGRAVGVVSHVTELKARIADRIQIRPSPDGSSRLVGAS